MSRSTVGQPRSHAAKGAVAGIASTQLVTAGSIPSASFHGRVLPTIAGARASRPPAVAVAHSEAFGLRTERQ
ncbi:MAG: hypothetical protein ABSC56_08825 [Solirubrobacteraceae bacterium]